MRRARTVWGWALMAALVWSPAAIAGEERGSAVIEKVDVALGLVVLGESTYRVVDSTEIEDAAGSRTSLAELPSLDSGASPDAAAVWFEAGDESGGAPRPLLRLKLTGGLPR